MSASAWFRRAALALVLLAVGAFAASQRNGWILVAGGSLAIAAVRVVDGPAGRALPAWAQRLGIFAAIGWGVQSFLSRPGPEEAPRAVGTVVLAAMVLTLWSRKSAAGWRQAIVLAIVLVVASALASTELAVGVLVVAFAALSVGAAMLYQLHAGEEAAAAEARAAVPPGSMPVAAVAASGADAGRHLRRLAAFGIAAGAACSIVVFLLFPRDHAAAQGQGSSRVSGFRTDVSLWGSGRISLSSRVAMTVRLLDPLGRPGELVRPLHMRGAVLDRYQQETGSWVAARPAASGRLLRPPAGGGFAWLSPEVADERSNVWTQDVEMRSLASDVVFSAWVPIGIASPDRRSFSFDPRTGELTAAAAGLSGRPRAYSVRMQSFPSPRVVRAVTGDSVPVEPGFPVPGVREIAERIVASAAKEDLPSAADAARDSEARWTRNRRLASIFRDHLSSEAFRYTTDLSAFRRVGERDPIELFLERYRFGHCEHFASAMAALCQSMGVEARVVTGYMTTEYDGASERFVFRESGAHAWAEVRTAEWQWSTFDASPMEELLAIQSANRTWMDRFRWVLDPVEFAWNSRFASFDGRSQAELGSRVADGARRAGNWFTEGAASAVERTNRWFRLGPAGAVWLGSVALTAAIAALAAVVTLRRARRASAGLSLRGSSLARRLALGRDAGFYLDALDELAAAGLAKPACRTPLAHAHAIAASHPGAAAAFERVVEAMYRIRYEGISPGHRERRRARLLVGRLRTALRGA